MLQFREELTAMSLSERPYGSSGLRRRPVSRRANGLTIRDRLKSAHCSTLCLPRSVRLGCRGRDFLCRCRRRPECRSRSCQAPERNGDHQDGHSPGKLAPPSGGGWDGPSARLCAPVTIIFGATGIAGAALVWNMAGLGFAPFLFDGGLLGFLILALRHDNGIWLRALTQARSRRSQ